MVGLLPGATGRQSAISLFKQIEAQGRQADARSALGLVIGTNVQAWDRELAALASTTSAADKLPYFTGLGAATTTDLSAYGRTLIDDADAATARSTLALASNDLAFTVAQSITLSGTGTALSLVSTDAGAGSGPTLRLYRNSASPAASDAISLIAFDGNNSVGTPLSYARIVATIADATNGSEDTSFTFWSMVNGSLTAVFGVNSLGVFTVVPDATFAGTISEGGSLLTAKYAQLANDNALTGSQAIAVAGVNYPISITDTDAGSSHSGGIELYRNSGSPANNDVLHNILSSGKNASGTKTSYGVIRAVIRDTTNGSEDGAYQFQTQVNGTLATRVEIQAGVQVGSPTGGDKGAGTLNATAVYDDNTLLTSMPASREYRETGDFDLAAWHGLMPAGREHRTATLFKAMVAAGFDARDPAQWRDKLAADEVLPGMPLKPDWRHNDLGLGDLLSRQWLAMDIMALSLSAIIDRVETLEAAR